MILSANQTFDPNASGRRSSVSDEELTAARPGSRHNALSDDAVLLRGADAARARRIDLVGGIRAVRLDAHNADNAGNAGDGGPLFRFEDVAAREIAEAQSQGRVEGFEQGLKTGFEQGKAEALASIEQAAFDVESRVDAVLNRLEDHFGSLAEHSASQTVDLALEIAEAVLSKEISTLEDPGADAIARCLDLLPPVGKMVVRLSPDDAETFSGIPSLADREIVVVADASLTSGDAVISVDQTTIDARLSASLERVAEALR